MFTLGEVIDLIRAGIADISPSIPVALRMKSRILDFGMEVNLQGPSPRPVPKDTFLMRIFSIRYACLALLILGLVGCKTRSQTSSPSWSFSNLNPFAKTADPSSPYPERPSQLTQPTVSMPPAGNFSSTNPSSNFSSSPASYSTPTQGIRNLQLDQSSDPFLVGSTNNDRASFPQQGPYPTGPDNTPSGLAGAPSYRGGPIQNYRDESNYRLTDRTNAPPISPYGGRTIVPPSSSTSSNGMVGLADYQRGIGSQFPPINPDPGSSIPESRGLAPPTEYNRTPRSVGVGGLSNSVPAYSSNSGAIGSENTRLPLGTTDYRPGVTPNPPGQTDYQPGKTGYNPPNVPPYVPPGSNFTPPVDNNLSSVGGDQVKAASSTMPTTVTDCPSHATSADFSSEWRPGNTSQWNPDSTPISFPATSGDLKYPVPTSSTSSSAVPAAHSYMR